ncbi:MAG TPA: exodeoxyribonuclease VII small subunit [Solirubrobacteraceae bacterium]|nr:exodeoxyribonuclease VII small subunit [Solirubrobacteraceae bacterium]
MPGAFDPTDPADPTDPTAGATGRISASGGPAAALTYESACARIEAIVRRLDSGEAGLRETLELCQEGKGLVEFCATELEAVGRGLEELQLDALVARLESGRAPG